AEFREFFDSLMAMGIDGMMISPGYAYEKAPQQDIFLKNEQTKQWFDEVLKGWRAKGWDFNHSPWYLDFLQGKREYDCTPWGNQPGPAQDRQRVPERWAALRGS